MNDFSDRAMHEWLREGPERGPDAALGRALAATRRTPQRPGWTFTGRWLPMQLTMRPAAVPRAALSLVLVALLLVALLATALFVGSQRRVPSPLGPAANGLIAFDAGQQIYVADADGANVRPLGPKVGADFAPAFSLDGTQLAFWSRQKSAQTFELVVAPVDGGEPRVVAADQPVTPEQLKIPPSWSPEGDRLVFAVTVDAVSVIAVAAADGSGVRRIPDEPVNPEAAVQRTQPRWSPASDWIAVRRAVPGQIELVVIRPDGTDERILYSQPADHSDDGTRRELDGYLWSPDGTRLVFHHTDEHGGDVATVDLDATFTAIADDPLSEFNPMISPDGRSVVFNERDGASLGIADIDGRNRRTLGPNPFGCQRTTVWSPDGAMLVGFTERSGCRFLGAIRLDDPATVIRVEGPPRGSLGLPTWQRLAP